jgi:hypothetical protein
MVEEMGGVGRLAVTMKSDRERDFVHRIGGGMGGLGKHAGRSGNQPVDYSAIAMTMLARSVVGAWFATLDESPLLRQSN